MERLILLHGKKKLRDIYIIALTDQSFLIKSSVRLVKSY